MTSLLVTFGAFVWFYAFAQTRSLLVLAVAILMVILSAVFWVDTFLQEETGCAAHLWRSQEDGSFRCEHCGKVIR